MSREAVETSRGTWHAPSAAERRRLLGRARTIAVVGASADPAKASNFVLSYLRSGSADYELWPVTPKGGEILGLKAYTSLQELPGTPDIVDVFRRDADVPPVATSAVVKPTVSFVESVATPATGSSAETDVRVRSSTSLAAHQLCGWTSASSLVVVPRR